MAMGSPLRPTVEDVFLCFYHEVFTCEVPWPEQCPKEFKPVFYRWYVDNIFVLFESAENLSKFCYYFTCNPNMSFSFEQEKMESCLSWYRSSCEKEKFVTTFSDAFTHFKTFLPTIYTDLVWFILFLIVVLKFVRLGQSFLDKFFLKNKYSLLFIDNCFKTFVHKLFIKHPQLTKVEKKTLFLPPQYLNRNFLTNKN